jgi:hypothetical protein
MHDLRLNSVKVCTSSLSQRPFRARSCELLLKVTRANKNKALAELKRTGELGDYDGLRISGIADLSFLKDFPRLLYLEIVDQKRVNTRHLDCLENLRGLRLETPGAGVDFACFPHLEVFSGDWHADNRNLDRGRELRRLSVWHYHGRSADLTDLAGLIRLEQLEITQTTLASLAGVELLEDLRYLDVAYASKLRSLEPLATGGAGIRELSLSKLPNAQSYRPLASIPQLRRLKLSSCAPMPDLRWTAGMNQLDFFSFVETIVEDGDLSPLLKLPKLEYVGTMDKRTYNYKCDALNQLLAAREQS